MYNSFTKEEIIRANDDFNHWNLSENKKWVVKSIEDKKKIKFVGDRFKELESYGFKLKKYSQQIYLLIQLEEIWNVIKGLDNAFT